MRSAILDASFRSGGLLSRLPAFRSVAVEWMSAVYSFRLGRDD